MESLNSRGSNRAYSPTIVSQLPHLAASDSTSRNAKCQVPEKLQEVFI